MIRCDVSNELLSYLFLRDGPECYHVPGLACLFVKKVTVSRRRREYG